MFTNILSKFMKLIVFHKRNVAILLLTNGSTLLTNLSFPFSIMTDIF